MLRACVVAERGARCREMIELPETRCPQHQGAKETAPQPDTILIKFFGLDKNELALLEKGGVRRLGYELQTEEKHRKHAEAYGQEFYAYRKDMGDSGTAVFGKKGARFVVLKDLIFEMMNEDYSPTDCHIKERPDKTPVLVVTFSNAEEGADVVLPSEVVHKILNLLTTDRIWGKIDVWANPPQEDGKVIHTVNCHWWGELKPGRFINILVFEKGLWNIDQKLSWL